MEAMNNSSFPASEDIYVLMRNRVVSMLSYTSIRLLAASLNQSSKRAPVFLLPSSSGSSYKNAILVNGMPDFKSHKIGPGNPGWPV